ncbi:hypothetical protein COT99_03695 [Candidatus Falkowbacteria bacterium CG10_big_fil_rev_8_21_14_0_10_43_10]|uniref:Radical SAM core domain-containing protein n=1 Tax=Candidatus Falkowbacteria bacterium CG10_big_fil_rev_8_21_14_0_10_43_10 TaxID=1974567 RepID=A0A2H0V1G1_9BACT|nr:MAG: hypothetical protein COT99_03695 [Candidatus Falkowbacteria bacterium CG10_big_fil_rev_8_21_14_0_10_43_10]
MVFLSASERRHAMYVRIRKERFGYVFFERFTRNVHFVETKENLEQLGREQLRKFVSRYYSGIGNAFHYEFVQSPENQFELGSPIGMYMEITRRCALDCRHCYKPDDPNAQLLTLEGWKRLIKELYDIGVFEIRLCGNEPLISPYFRQICEFISGLNLFLGINTCGFFGEQTREDLIALHPDFVAISIDGNEESHNQIRGPDSYQRAVMLLKKLSKTNIRRRINSVVSTLTLSTTEHTVKLADEFGADVSFIPFRPIGRHADFSAKCSIGRDQMWQSVQEVTRLRQQYPHLLLLTYFDVLGEHATYHHSMNFNSPCPARKNGFIGYSGDFYPCDFLRSLGRIYYCGNVAEHGFWPIWTSSPVLNGFRCLKHDKCKRCSHYMKKCYGGCISGSIASTGCPDDQLCFIDIQ